MYTTKANGRGELAMETGKPVTQSGVTVFYFPRMTSDHSHFSPGLLLHLWRTASQYDIVHIHSWWNLVSIFSLIICLLKGITPVVSPRGMLSDYTVNGSKAKALFHKLIGARVLRKTLLHATTFAESYELTQKIPGATVEVIYNLATLSPLMRNTAQNDTFKLVYLSRIDAKKGVDILFAALSRISLPFHLTIAGDGDADYISRLKALAEELKLTDSITWCGHVSGDQKFSMLAENDLFLLISHNENFANVVIEALSAGTPVLISEGVGLADYVQRNELGWVSSMDPDRIAGHLDAIYSQRHRLQEVGRKASYRIEQDFNHETLANEYIRIYKKI